MQIIGTRNTGCGLMQGLKIMEQGGSALDAVEAVLREVELDHGDDSVGIAGLPNLLGQVELDASIMDGTTLRAGAIGAIQGFSHPITIARKVMELLPHVLLVGEGAAHFASELNMERLDMPIPSAEEKYYKHMRETGLLETVKNTSPDNPLHDALWRNINYRPGGTANVIAQDKKGHICCGVTTSGWAFKYPGRLGDSPIIGAGNYADDRYGAAACTGLGEVTMRLCSAHAVIQSLSCGLNLEQATKKALADIIALPVAIPFGLNILSMDQKGHHTYYTNRPENNFYVAAFSGCTEPQQLAAKGIE